MGIFFKKILHNKKHNSFFVFLTLFLSICSYFPIGAIHSSTAIENTSEYLTDVTKNHTINGTYTAMMVEPNDITDKKINNPNIDFYKLYGIFGEGFATYIGSANSDKRHSIKLKDIDEDINFSFLNVDSGFEVKEYYKDMDGNIVYKTDYYPLELMFYSSPQYVPGQFSFLYISQSRADSLLDKVGLEHNRENYHSLLNTLITLEFDGTEYKFAINNIYFERNYFYKALDEVMGEFFLSGEKYPSGIKKQGIFFLRNYAYQNKYYINYATKLYSQNDFVFQILEKNFKNNFQIDKSKLVFYANAANNAISIMLVCLAALLLISCVALIISGLYDFTIKNNILVMCALLIPYAIFWIIHLFSKYVVLFSNFSTNCVIWSILIFVIIYLIAWLIQSQQKRIDIDDKFDS